MFFSFQYNEYRLEVPDLESRRDHHRQCIPVQFMVLYVFRLRKFQQFLLRGASSGRGRRVQDSEDHLAIRHSQRETGTLFSRPLFSELALTRFLLPADLDRDAAHDRGVHIHGDSLQLLPQILRTGRGRRSRQEMS